MMRRAGRFVAISPHTGDKPVLFVDIDGVISLWDLDSYGCPPGALHNVDAVIHFLSSDTGNHLLDLLPRFELVWCSGWEEKPTSTCRTRWPYPVSCRSSPSTGNPGGGPRAEHGEE